MCLTWSGWRVRSCRCWRWLSASITSTSSARQGRRRSAARRRGRRGRGHLPRRCGSMWGGHACRRSSCAFRASGPPAPPAGWPAPRVRSTASAVGDRQLLPALTTGRAGSDVGWRPGDWSRAHRRHGRVDPTTERAHRLTGVRAPAKRDDAVGSHRCVELELSSLPCQPSKPPGSARGCAAPWMLRPATCERGAGGHGVEVSWPRRNR